MHYYDEFTLKWFTVKLIYYLLVNAVVVQFMMKRLSLEYTYGLGLFIIFCTL